MDFETTNVREVYSKISEHFNHTRHYKWKWIEDFLDAIPENSLVCDVGCGNGRNMTRDTLKFKGVDNCPEFVKICTDQGLDVIKSDMCKLPFEDNTFDALISIASFHHLCIPERRLDCLNEMKRIMKPGTRCMISVWSKNQPEKTKRTFDNYGHNFVEWKSKNGTIHNRYYYIFEIDEITALFTKAGFTIVSHKWDCGNEVFILKKE